MKKTILTAIAISALLISFMASMNPNLVRADSTDSIVFSDSGITLFSPLNATYNYRNLILNLTAYWVGGMGSIDPYVSMNYSIDGKYNGSVQLKVANPGLHVATDGSGIVNLPELPDGSHRLTIYFLGFAPYNGSLLRNYQSFVNTVYFSIYDPTTTFTDHITFMDSDIFLYSPLNITYNRRDLTLNLTVPVWSILGLSSSVSMNYSIDGLYNGPVPLRWITPPESPPIGNVMALGAGIVDLPDLPDGGHALTLYLYGYNMQGHQPILKSYVNSVYFLIYDPNSTFIPTPSLISTPTLTPSPSPTPTPSLTPSASPNPSVNPTSTPSPSLNPSPSSSPVLTPSPSLTPEPTIEPSSSASSPLIVDHFPNYPLMLQLGIVAIAIIAVAGVLVYFKKMKK